MHETTYTHPASMRTQENTQAGTQENTQAGTQENTQAGTQEDTQQARKKTHKQARTAVGVGRGNKVRLPVQDGRQCRHRLQHAFAPRPLAAATRLHEHREPAVARHQCAPGLVAEGVCQQHKDFLGCAGVKGGSTNISIRGASSSIRVIYCCHRSHRQELLERVQVRQDGVLHLPWV